MKKVSVRVTITLLMMAFALGATLFTGVIIYRQMEKQLLDDAWQRQEALLDTACTAVNRRVEQIRSLSWQLSNNSEVKTLLYARQLTPQSILTMRGVIETLQTMKAFDGTIRDVGLYIAGINRVITAESSYDADTYYARISGVGRADLASLRAGQEGGMLASFAGVVSIERIIETEKALVFVSALPIGRGNGENYTFFHLSMEEMSGLVRGADNSLFLMDGEGNALGGKVDAALAALCGACFASGEAGEKRPGITYEGREYGWLVRPTDSEGLYCAAVVPYEALRDNAHRIGKTVVLMMSGFMMLAIVLAIFAGRRFYAPLGRLMDSLQALGHGAGEKGNEYEQLSDALGYYSRTNQTLSLSWQEARGVLKNQVVQALLEGRLKPGVCEDGSDGTDGAEAAGLQGGSEALRKAGVTLPYPLVQAAVFAGGSALERLQDEQHVDIAEYVEQQMHLRDMGGMVLWCARRENGELLLLFNIAANHPKPENLDLFLQECCLPLSPEGRIGIGRCYAAQRMADSLVEAMLALRAEGEGAIRHVEEVDMGADEDFTLSAEQTLVRLIQGGDQEALCAFLEKLWTQEDGTVLLRESLQQSLLLCARRLARQSGAEEALENALKENGLRLSDLPLGEENAQALCRVFQALSDSLPRGGGTQEDRHLQRLMDYIMQEYMHDEISLDTASAATGLSPSYIGVIFRHANTSFLKALTDVRMSRASEMLRSTDLTVREIGEQVGMANQNTFIRAFKKARGVTPGQYRMAEKTMDC